MNANEADQMVDCLHARAGFTWDHSQKQCIEAPKAGCSKTTNKFIYYDKCHESMLPRKRTEFIKKKIVIFFFSSLFANCSTKTFRMRYKCFAKRKYSI